MQRLPKILDSVCVCRNAQQQRHISILNRS